MSFSESRCIPRQSTGGYLLSNLAELVFSYLTQRADPILRNILPRRAGRNAVIRNRQSPDHIHIRILHIHIFSSFLTPCCFICYMLKIIYRFYIFHTFKSERFDFGLFCQILIGYRNKIGFDYSLRFFRFGHL